MPHRTLVFAICSGCAVLIGCSGYAVTVNQRPVWRPPPILPMADIDDPNLATCVEQILIDQQVTEASELRRVVCTNAGIQDLAGLEQFNKLAQLDLSHNELRSVEALSGLPELNYLRVEGNPDLPCGELDSLAAQRGDRLEIDAPRHCR